MRFHETKRSSFGYAFGYVIGNPTPRRFPLGAVFLDRQNSLVRPSGRGSFRVTVESPPAFAILFMVSFFFLVFMVTTRQWKWRGRDILELAAQPVDEVVEGYTARPHPAGKAEYTRKEIMDFANFARRKLIAWTFVERDRVVFSLVKMGDEFGYLFSPNRGYDGTTWVAFDNGGNITVNISEADYLGFREDFDFDRLCSSLADVFVDFLDMHRKGQDTRIMDRLDAMKIGLFS